MTTAPRPGKAQPMPRPPAARPPSWQEGRDGRRATYTETLSAPWALWLFGVIMTASLGIAYGYATSPAWGLATFAAAQAVVTWGLLATSPRVRVDERVLRAGRARLPRGCVGRVRVCDAATVRRLRGVDADPRAYLCLRSWVPGAVVVEVADPADPHPYWLVSTRHPQRLSQALAGPAYSPDPVEG